MGRGALSVSLWWKHRPTGLLFKGSYCRLLGLGEWGEEASKGKQSS